MHQTRQTPQCLFIKAERFANFARCQTPAICNHVRGHRRAKLAVAFVNVLNRALTLIAARQIEIDVRPLTALFGKKPFEQKFHADGIDSGDSQAVANCAIGRRTATLDENAVAFAELNDVPDD